MPRRNRNPDQPTPLDDWTRARWLRDLQRDLRREQEERKAD